MDVLSPFPAVAALLVALVTIFFLKSKAAMPPSNGRYGSIDGLRGYLAFFVFLHHSSIWYFYLRTGECKLPESNLYTHFGQSSVALFFMLSGFLFYSKLLDGRKRPINWTRLYISRVFRLGPLYYFALSIIFVIIAFLSHFTLKESPLLLLKELFEWGTFTLHARPDINAVKGTIEFMAGETWSLRYEWVFYFSLPLLAFALRISVPLSYLITSSILMALAILRMHLDPIHIVSFAGGITSVYLVRIKYFCVRASSNIASIIVLTCIILVVICYRSAYSIIPLLLLSVAFGLVACGNTLFGVLETTVSRLLGELTYGIYLLHPIVTYVTFKFIIGFKIAATLSPLQHWLVIICCTPFLILISFATFKVIEAPSMVIVYPVSVWLKTRLSWPIRESGVPAKVGTPEVS